MTAVAGMMVVVTVVMTVVMVVIMVVVVMTRAVMMVGFVYIHFQFSLSGFLMKVLEAVV